MKRITLEEFHKANGVVHLEFEEVWVNKIVYAYKHVKFTAYIDDNEMFVFTPKISSDDFVVWSRIIDEDAEE